MPSARIRVPSYRLHKPSGRAVVTLGGHHHYLGPHGSKVSRDEYLRLINEWTAAGGVVTESKETISVIRVVNAFRKAGEIPASHAHSYKAAIGVLLKLYSRRPAAEFGPKALMAVREQMISIGWARKTINQRIYMVRVIFRWAAAHEMISGSVYHALTAVKGLRKGGGRARESKKVQPVAIDHVNACLPHMPKLVQAMVRLQLLTGMRAGELVIMRTGDIDTTGKVWIYRPGSHKTAHLDHMREVAVGPQAIAILKPFLRRDLEAFVFSPADSELERRQTLTRARTTPHGRGNSVGSNRRPSPQRSPGDRYDVPSYRRAVYRAADTAFPPPAPLARQTGERETEWKKRLGDKWPELRAWRRAHRWNPHQLRHSFGELVRKQFGLEHAQRSLGHANAKVTEVYASVALEKAVEVAEAIG